MTGTEAFTSLFSAGISFPSGGNIFFAGTFFMATAATLAFVAGRVAGLETVLGAALGAEAFTDGFRGALFVEAFAVFPRFESAEFFVCAFLSPTFPVRADFRGAVFFLALFFGALEILLTVDFFTVVFFEAILFAEGFLAGVFFEAAFLPRGLFTDDLVALAFPLAEVDLGAPKPLEAKFTNEVISASSFFALA